MASPPPALPWLSFSLAFSLLSALARALTGVAVVSTAAFAVALVALRVLSCARPTARTTVGFFHPYCAAGGGGERVLWCAVAALARAARLAGARVDVVVFTGDAASARDIVCAASNLFGVKLPEPVEGAPSLASGGDGSGRGATLHFVRIRTRRLLEARTWPRLTLLGQSLGSAIVALECFARARVDVWVDTTGAAFSLPIARAAGARAATAYVHYPTVSTEMLDRVAARTSGFNNANSIARSPFLTAAKLAYYRVFAAAYGSAGRAATAGGVMVNSKWTAAHIRTLWAREPVVVYPPCPTADLRDLPLDGRDRLVVSIAQFRPEKNHELQLRAFADACESSDALSGVRLALIGGVRDEADEGRVAALRKLAATFGIAHRVDFHTNAPFATVRRLLGRATAGLHSMSSEHFGIGVVEMQAAGVVTIAHDSGGPQSDIIVPPWRRTQQPRAAPPVGLLASSRAEYAAALTAVFDGSVDVKAVAAAGRAAAARFSDEAFKDGFLAVLWPIIHLGPREMSARKSPRSVSGVREKRK
jgi:alpha-1,2-mannosyltransferase